MGAPLTLITGLPGNGKTLNSIKELDAQAVKEDRVVYFHNIRGLKPETLKAQWYEFDNALEWFKLPENSLILVDEAQGFFPVRDPRKEVPEHCSQIETIRHGGRELWLVTQDANFLDVHVRRLCNRHVHFKRIFKSSKVLRHEWEQVTDTTKAASYKAAMTTPIKLDRKFFGSYESTAQGAKHFLKFKPPLALYVLIPVLAFTGYYGFEVYDMYQRAVEPAKPAEAPVRQQEKGADKSMIGQVADAITPAGKGKQTVEQYLHDRAPRIASVPSSAPVYDDLTKPVSFPRTYCLSSRDEGFLERQGVRKRMKIGLVDGKRTGCGCYTQQGTTVATTFEYCMNAVNEGIFDPTIPDRGSRSMAMSLPGQSAVQTGASVRDVGALRALDGQPSVATAANDGVPGSVRVTIVPDSEYPARPWR